GMWVAPEKAADFGVFMSPRNRPTELACFLQKPPAAKIRELSQNYLCLVDTGMWLLSERAVSVLMQRCGWDAQKQEFSGAPDSQSGGDGGAGRSGGVRSVPRGGAANHYELYAQFGLALGKTPSAPDPEVSALSCAVVPLPEAEFYHFGTNAQMIESVSV